MCVHDCHILTNEKKSAQINDLKEGEPMLFNRKRDAQTYININYTWALKPVKVRVNPTVWKKQNVIYHLV